jgi:hypothetical protein
MLWRLVSVLKIFVALWISAFNSVGQYFTLLIVASHSCYFEERVVVAIRGWGEDGD